MQTLEALIAQSRQLQTRNAALVGRKSQLTNDLTSVESNMALAKGRLDLKEEVNEVLNLLQDEVHKKAVGKFEQCLTGILRDVFPGEDRIVIEVGLERQETSITISVTNGENLEDVMDGRGGSIANVMSIGLRFIALKRSGLRPFIVLDEADCWLKPERVPALAKVIGQLSRELEIQVLLISHHSPEFFHEHADIVYLQRQGNSVSATTLDESLWKGDRQGLRSIHLRNFQSHENTTINLSPYVTALVGDNDIGKSAIVNFIKGATEGTGKASWIRHGKEEAYGEMDFGPEGVLCYTRTHAKSHNTIYELKKRGRSINFSEGDDYKSVGSKLPYWIEKMGFAKPNGLDVQIGYQKQPIFLLNESGMKQAMVLSIGKESVYLGAMQKTYKKLLDEDSKLLKEGDKRKAYIKERLEYLDGVEDIQKQIDALQIMIQKTMAQASELKAMEIFIKRFEKYQAVCDSLKVIEGQLPEVLKAPEMEDTHELLSIGSKWSKAVKMASIERIDAIAAPEMAEVAGLEQLMRKIEKIEAAKLVEAQPLLPALAAQLDILELHQIGFKWSDANKKRQEAINEQERLDAERAEIQRQLDAVIEAMGGECPVCHGSLKSHHEHDEHDDTCGHVELENAA